MSKDTGQEAITEATKKITEFMKKEKPYLFLIEEQVQNNQSGLVRITLRVFKGKVTDVVLHGEKRVKFE